MPPVQNQANSLIAEVSANFTAGVGKMGTYRVTKSLTFTAASGAANDGIYHFIVPQREKSALTGNTLMVSGSIVPTNQPGVGSAAISTETPTLTLAPATGKRAYAQGYTTNTGNELLLKSGSMTGVCEVYCQDGNINVIRAEGVLTRA